MATTKDEKALIADIVNMRDKQDKGWGDIVEKIGMSPGKVMLLYLKGTVKERFKGTTDSALAKEVASARKAGDSWGIISVKGQFSEARARNLFEQATGKNASGDRIGKGGRYPNGTSAPAKAAKAKAPAAKKGTTKAAATKSAKPAAKAGGSAKKAAGSTKGLSDLLGGTGGPVPKPAPGVVVPLREMDLEQLQARLNGKTITVGRATKPTRIGVKHVLSLEDGTMEFSDLKNGGMRQVLVADIIKASR